MSPNFITTLTTLVLLKLSSQKTSIIIPSTHTVTKYVQPNLSFYVQDIPTTSSNLCLHLLTPPRVLGCTNKIKGGRTSFLLTKVLPGNYTFKVDDSDPVYVTILESSKDPIFYETANGLSGLRDELLRVVRHSELTCSPQLQFQLHDNNFSSDQTKNENEFQSFWLYDNLFKNKVNGFFVESGAADIHTSVTEFFERNSCWVGVGIEPQLAWAESNGVNRPNMLSIHGALCEAGGSRGNFVVNEDNHLSGFGGGDSEGSENSISVSCNHPNTLFGVGTGLGVTHVDLFVLDCEGCELEVLTAIDLNLVEVDVFLVEANMPLEVRALLERGGRYELVACIGIIDMVYLRRGSNVMQEWGFKGEEMRRGHLKFCEKKFAM